MLAHADAHGCAMGCAPSNACPGGIRRGPEGVASGAGPRPSPPPAAAPRMHASGARRMLRGITSPDDQRSPTRRRRPRLTRGSVRRRLDRRRAAPRSAVRAIQPRSLRRGPSGAPGSRPRHRGRAPDAAHSAAARRRWAGTAPLSIGSVNPAQLLRGCGASGTLSRRACGTPYTEKPCSSCAEFRENELVEFSGSTRLNHKSTSGRPCATHRSMPDF